MRIGSARPSEALDSSVAVDWWVVGEGTGFARLDGSALPAEPGLHAVLWISVLGMEALGMGLIEATRGKARGPLGGLPSLQSGP